VLTSRFLVLSVLWLIPRHSSRSPPKISRSRHLRVSATNSLRKICYQQNSPSSDQLCGLQGPYMTISHCHSSCLIITCHTYVKPHVLDRGLQYAPLGRCLLTQRQIPDVDLQPNPEIGFIPQLFILFLLFSPTFIAQSRLSLTFKQSRSMCHQRPSLRVYKPRGPL
jgi:hypothetical protein